MAKEKKVTKRVDKPKGEGKRLTEGDLQKIRDLRKSDPEKWTYVALAGKFGCTDGTAFRAVNADKKPRKAKAAKKAGPKKAKKAGPKKAAAKKAPAAASEPVEVSPQPPQGE